MKRRLTPEQSVPTSFSPSLLTISNEPGFLPVNTYAVIILAALLAEYVLNLVSDGLNLRNLQSALPDEFSDTFVEETKPKRVRVRV